MEVALLSGLALALLAAHAPFLAAFLSRVRERKMPGSLLFAAMGVVLYYDLGFLLQASGWIYTSMFFPSLRSLTSETLVAVWLIVLAAPYLLAAGHRVASLGGSSSEPVSDIRFSPRLRHLFFVIFVPLCAALGIVGFQILEGASSVAEAKSVWMGVLGRSYVVFLVPMFVLAFFMRTTSARSRLGMLFVGFLLIASTLSTLFLGQRTMTLLPILMVMLFAGRVSLLRLGTAVMLLFGIASVALWYYKGFAVEREAWIGDRVVAVVNNDLIRTNVLARAIDESELVGSRIMPTAGQGYAYSLLLYVPRTLLPNKGHSTAAYFTAFANGEETNYLSWGLGVGFLEEIVLNFGLLAIIPGAVLYGVFLALLERLARSWPSALVGTRLAPVWMCGYGSSSVLLYFGSMTIFSILLEGLFAESATNMERRQSIARVAHAPVADISPEGAH